MLVLVQGSLGAQPAGPAIRGWEMARVLARRHDVTVLAPDTRAGQRDGVRVVPFSRARAIREVARHDAVIAPTLPPYLLACLSIVPAIAVSDQYDPVDLELETRATEDRAVRRHLRVARAVRALQLRFADVVVCAGERQRRQLEAEQARITRRRAPAPIWTVPFGLTSPPAGTGEQPFRDRFPAIRCDDTLVLWWGTIWKWLDASTAVRALAQMAATRDDVKLVITAGRPPDPSTEKLVATAAARELARSLGILDGHVFFYEDWIPYERRADYLGEADIGLTLHDDTPEAALAARARYMDYLANSLPCVLGEGDEVARQLSEGGLATLVPPRSPDAVAEAIAGLADDSGRRSRAQESACALAHRFQWPAVVDPLVTGLERISDQGVGRRRQPPSAVTAALGFYGRRVLDKLAGARDRASCWPP